MALAELALYLPLSDDRYVVEFKDGSGIALTQEAEPRPIIVKNALCAYALLCRDSVAGERSKIAGWRITVATPEQLVLGRYAKFKGI